MHLSRYILALAVGCCIAATICSCTNDAYDTGDGDYSYLRADFGEVATGADTCCIVGAETDEGETLSFNQPYRCRWAAVADTTYRALIYYNKVNDDVEPVSIVAVSVLHAMPLADGYAMHDDPVMFESVWMSPNGKYLNMGIALKSGKADAVDARHVIGLVPHSSADNADGTHTVAVQLYHNRNSVPEYYTVRTYLSFPLADYPDADTLKVLLNTYDGMVEKKIKLGK